MNVPVQLDLFRTKEECEIIALRGEVNRVYSTCDKLRKAMWARHGEISKRQVDLEERLTIVEKGICQYGSG